MAYGKDYTGQQRPKRVMSHDRERPGPQAHWQQVYAELPVDREHDWYAAQKKTPTPAMAGVIGQVMQRDGRARTMPTATGSQGYSQSSPQLVVSELDGTGVGMGVARRGTDQGRHGQAQAQVPVYAELDSRETERYHAFAGRGEKQVEGYKAYRG